VRGYVGGVGFVGDGFIRPEVCTFVSLRSVTCSSVERGKVGTDKSVPYGKPSIDRTTVHCCLYWGWGVWYSGGEVILCKAQNRR